VEQEIILVLILLCSSIGFFVGSIVSPSSRMKSKEIQYWRGLTGDFKKQLKTEKRNNGEGGIDELLAGDFSIGSILKLVKNNPSIISDLKPALDLLKGSMNQSKLQDFSKDEKGRLR
tara:strand:+ start:116 stop:466 length:351 start_codon:yes stop_codon:yes gene_type:complete